MGNSLIKRLTMLAATMVTLPALAQLPELASPSTGSGASTSAQFFGGASADNGLSFGAEFAFDQAIDITGEIRPEASHVDTTGNIYLVAQLGEQLLYRDTDGNYLPWDINDLSTLQPTAAGKTLAAVEALTIVDDIALGPAGVFGTTLSIFFAYDTAAAPGELYFSGAPLAVTIAEQVQQPTEPQSQTLFVQNISQPIIQSRCIACHVSGGVASNTRLVYVRNTTPDFQTINYNTLADFMQTASGAANLLLNKPQGLVSHSGGVQLTAGTNLDNWIEFVNALEVDAQ